MAYDTLLVERRGPVGWLIFDRPDAGNAMDATMFRELEAAWRELDDDPAVRVSRDVHDNLGWYEAEQINK